MAALLVIKLFVILCCLAFAGSVPAENATERTADQSGVTTTTVHSASLLSARVTSQSAAEVPSTTTPEPPYNERVHRKWEEFEKFAGNLIEGQIRRALKRFLKVGLEANLTPVCTSSLMQVVFGVRGLKSWAVRMVDASGKLPAGLLDGSLTDFGDFDQCLAVVREDRGKVKFRGQYCSVEATPLLPHKPKHVMLKTRVLHFQNFSDKDSVLMDFSRSAALFYLMTIRVGVCLPSTCSKDDVQQMVQLAAKKTPLDVKVKHCQVAEDFHLTTLQIATIAIVGSLAALAVLGTAVDAVLTRRRRALEEVLEKPQHKENGKVVETLLAFSLDKNLRKVLATPSSTENFGALNGLRCLSMMWIILVHTYGFSHRQGFGRMQNAQNSLEYVTFAVIINAWVSVDTFFVIGAFLVAHANLKKMEKKKGLINLPRYFLHRFWRLTPPVAGVLAVMFLLPLVGSGPLFPDVVGRQSDLCRRYWWQALLPLNTWMDYDEVCLLHTWYTAADMHFYCLAPLVLYPLYRWPKIGFFLMGGLTLVCMGIMAAVTIAYDFYPTVLYFTPDEPFSMKMLNLAYFRPYPHVGAYCVGLAAGYFVLRHRHTDIKWFWQLCGWCLAVACNVAVLFGAFEWNRGNLPGSDVTISYAMLHRTGWALGIAWIIFMCITGRGGLVNRLLSWRFFVPLSRLSYSVYLLHFPVIWLKSGLRHQRYHFHHYDIAQEFIGTLVTTVAASLSFHLLFEAPFLNLETVWFPRRSRTKTLENGTANGTCQKTTFASNGHPVAKDNNGVVMKSFSTHM